MARGRRPPDGPGQFFANAVEPNQAGEAFGVQDDRHRPRQLPERAGPAPIDITAAGRRAPGYEEVGDRVELCCDVAVRTPIRYSRSVHDKAGTSAGAGSATGCRTDTGTTTSDVGR